MSYAQTSYPNVPLGDGSCGESIATAGCYVTTDAMILTWTGHPIDPPSLNAEYLAKGLFQNGCLISSDTLARARPTEITLDSSTEFPGAADLSLADTQTDGIYAAVRIAYPHGTQADLAAGRVHFAPVYDYTAGHGSGELRIVDSWDGQIKPLANYGDPATIVTAIMRYRALTAAAPAPPPDPILPPKPPPAPVQPPSPVVAFTGDPRALEGRWAWEFRDPGDYPALKALGYDGVLIRAFNGEGGATAESQLASWKTHSVAARAAGLKAIAWTYWYGPGEPGYTETDPAAYLVRCAKATAALGLDTPGWVVDIEAHELEGIAPALKLLRDLSGKAVFPCTPGDPAEFGLSVDWKGLDVVVDGYVPQLYTGAWGPAVSLAKALAEWNAARPIYPASDEVDAVKARAWLDELAPNANVRGVSYWRLGVGTTETLRAYGRPGAPPTQPPTLGYLVTAADGFDLTAGTRITDLRQAMALADVYAKAHKGISVYVRDAAGATAYTAFERPADLPPVGTPNPTANWLSELLAALARLFAKWSGGGS